MVVYWRSKKKIFYMGNKEIKNQYYLEKILINLILKQWLWLNFQKNGSSPGFVHGGASCSVLDELTEYVALL